MYSKFQSIKDIPISDAYDKKWKDLEPKLGWESYGWGNSDANALEIKSEVRPQGFAFAQFIIEVKSNAELQEQISEKCLVVGGLESQ